MNIENTGYLRHKKSAYNFIFLILDLKMYVKIFLLSLL